MSEKVFRQKALNKISSPEDLNETICVTNPGIWLILTSILVLLLGASCWGIFGHIDTTTQIKVNVQDGMAVGLLDLEQVDCIHEGMPARFDGADGVVTSIQVDTEHNQAEIHLDVALPDGIHTGTIVTESIHPFSFITN